MRGTYKYLFFVFFIITVIEVGLSLAYYIPTGRVLSSTYVCDPFFAVLTIIFGILWFRARKEI